MSTEQVRLVREDPARMRRALAALEAEVRATVALAERVSATAARLTWELEEALEIAQGHEAEVRRAIELALGYPEGGEARRQVDAYRGLCGGTVAAAIERLASPMAVYVDGRSPQQKEG